VVTDAPPQVQRLGKALLIQGPAIALTAHLLQVGAERVRDRNGTVLPGTEQLVREAREAAGMSGERHRVMVNPPDREELTSEGVIDAREAAEMLGLGVRQVQRLAASLGAQRVGRTFVYDRGAVTAYAAHRAEEANR